MPIPQQRCLIIGIFLLTVSRTRQGSPTVTHLCSSQPFLSENIPKPRPPLTTVLPYAPMVKSSFKYCLYRGERNPSRKKVGFYCRHPCEGTELGPFATDAAAARALAKVLGVRYADLAKSEVPMSAASKFKYVTSRVRCDGTQRWVAQPTAGIQRQFSNQRDAADWVVAQKKTSIGAISGRRPFYRLELRKRVDLMMEVCGKGELPGDLDDLRRRATSVALSRAIQEEPAIEIIIAQGKYGPFRECLMASLRHKQSPKSKCKKGAAGSKVQGSQSRSGVKGSKVLHTLDSSQSKIQRAKVVLSILQQTCRLCDGRDFSYWASHVGRNVGYFSAFVPMLLRLGVIARAANGRTGLRLSSANQRYQLTKGAQAEHRAIAKIGRLITFSDTMMSAIGQQRPTSTMQWCEMFERIRGAISSSPSPGLTDPDSYLSKWTIRTLLLRRLWVARRGRLQISPETTWREFISTFPDQNNYAQQIAGRFPRAQSCSIREFIEHAGLSSQIAPELLTMHLCLVGQTRKHSTAFLESHKTAMKRFRVQFKSATGYNPAVAHIVSSVAGPRSS